uniref:Vesicle-associated membrane protein 7 n=1 Tax=Timema douglasi TaxID=61478 RepID=A0A7R8VV02_TIMDO|nr:unnamed protein product [Timema douglasi]
MASTGETEKSNSQHVKLQIRHSCVCNRQYILMSHQTEPENYSPVVYSILGNLDVEGNRKLTFPIDRFQMHVIVDNGLVFSCITYKTNHHYMPFMFLETFQRKFHEIPSLVSRSVHARENEFDRDFGPVLTTIVYEFNIGRGDKISQLQVQVDDVKRIMLDNVEKVMQRGEDLDNLLTKTESLESSVRVTVIQTFQRALAVTLVEMMYVTCLKQLLGTGLDPSRGKGYSDWASVPTPIHVQEDGLLGLGLCLHPHVRGRATWTGPLSPPPSTCKRTGYLDWASVSTPIHVQEDGLLGLGALSPSTCKRTGYLDWASVSTPIHVQEDGLLGLGALSQLLPPRYL